MNRKLAALLLCLAYPIHTLAAGLEVQIALFSQIEEERPVLSNVLTDPDDQAIKGAELAVDDSNTTGRFLGHSYGLELWSSDDPNYLVTEALAAYERGYRYFVVDLSLDLLRAFQSELPSDAVLFNATNPDDPLRVEQCDQRTFHTYPSRAMLTDALAQWIKAKQFEDVLLIRGQASADLAYADAFKRAAKRFGLNLVETLVWDFDTDLRRTAQKELPLFTQVDEYDLVVVADELGDFGEYVPFNTWYPRPVVGTQGLTPVAWHRVVEQWGAAQLQSRFEEKAGRWMNDEDYGAWLAVRSIAEAVTRINTAEPGQVSQYLKSNEFELAAFKGRKLSYRGWNQQLRQPIPLVHPRALVSQSPQEGFLHPQTDLDTLGFDRPESQCALDR